MEFFLDCLLVKFYLAVLVKLFGSGYGKFFVNFVDLRFNVVDERNCVHIGLACAFDFVSLYESVSLIFDHNDVAGIYVDAAGLNLKVSVNFLLLTLSKNKLFAYFLNLLGIESNKTFNEFDIAQRILGNGKNNALNLAIVTAERQRFVNGNFVDSTHRVITVGGVNRKYVFTVSIISLGNSNVYLLIADYCNYRNLIAYIGNALVCNYGKHNALFCIIQSGSCTLLVAVNGSRVVFINTTRCHCHNHSDDKNNAYKDKHFILSHKKFLPLKILV